MSAQQITKSQRLIAEYEESRRRDKLAFEIADREGVSFCEAYLRVLDKEKR